MLKKYLQDYFQYQLSHILGGKKYSTWASTTLSLQKNIPIKNKKLAKELEDACQKKGFLTYAEYLTLDQFGENGYHNTHKKNGMTDVISRWPEALAALCQKKEFHHLVEFGPGNGKVGIKTLWAAKKLHWKLSWSGIEINEELRNKTKLLFTRVNLKPQLFQLVEKISELKIKEKCLFVFSYSLDNLAPEVFINTTSTRAYPDAMVGITVNNGLLSEVLLSENEIKSTGSILKNGCYTDALGYTWDIRKWQLNTMQRAYLHIELFHALIETLQSLPQESQILIIDEFHIPSSGQETYHIGLPKDLETFSRDYESLQNFYKTAGSNLLYFTPYLNSIISFFTQTKFLLEENTSEHKLAFTLSGRNIPFKKRTRTLALLTSPKKADVKQKKFVFAPLSNTMDD